MHNLLIYKKKNHQHRKALTKPSLYEVSSQRATTLTLMDLMPSNQTYMMLLRNSMYIYITTTYSRSFVTTHFTSQEPSLPTHFYRPLGKPCEVRSELLSSNIFHIYLSSTLTHIWMPLRNLQILFFSICFWNFISLHTK